jgi:hypothetical protein
MQKYWLLSGVVTLFTIPALLSVPIAAKAGQTYWILYVVFRSGNPNVFDAPIEWFFWAELVIPIALALFFFSKATSKSKISE